MDKPIFKTRLLNLQKKLKAEKIPALLVTNPFNVIYLTDFTGTNGQLFITPKKAFFITDFRYLTLAKKLLIPQIKLINMQGGLTKTLQSLIQKNRIQTTYFEAQHLSFLLYSHLKKTLRQIKPSNNLIENLRIIKDQTELKYIIKAQRIAEQVFLKVKQDLKPGKTEIEISNEIELLAKKHGADCVSFASIVAFNENSAIPHHQPTSKKLEKGDIVLIDMGMKYKNYCSDMTRMIFTKKPSSQQQKIYNIVLKAQEESIKKLKPNSIGHEIDKIARNIIQHEGYGKTFGHSLGHGIGLEVHESPNSSPNFHGKIAENTIITAEPGIYLENNFGVRIEDMVLVKKTGNVNLTKIPKKIEDCVHML